MNLEDRIKRRLLMEAPIVEASYAEDVAEIPWTSGFLPDDYPTSPYEPTGWHEQRALVSPAVAARIAALEAEDSANPIAQTEQVRPPLRLNIDTDAFQAVYDLDGE